MTSLEEFDTMSKLYALNHIDDAIYKWMKTQQPTNFDFNYYIDMMYKQMNNETYLTLKDIHPDFVMTYILIETELGSYRWNKHYNTTHQYHTIKMEKDQVLNILVTITSIHKESGILDMILEFRN